MTARERRQKLAELNKKMEEAKVLLQQIKESSETLGVATDLETLLPKAPEESSSDYETSDWDASDCGWED